MSFIRILAFVVVCVLAAVPAGAQEIVPRVEVGGQVASAAVTRAPHAGFGAWLDINLSRQLAIEARVAGYPSSQGALLHGSAGIRATLVRTRRASVYGFVLPGLFHDPSVPRWIVLEPAIDVDGEGPEVILVGLSGPPEPQTHFVLDLGGGVALFPSSRFVMRIEMDRDIHARPGTPLAGALTPTSLSYIPEYIGSQWNLHVGASYRFGSPLKAADAGATMRTTNRWTVGPQMGVTVATSASAMGTVGAFASYRLGRHVDVDASASGFISDALQTSPWEGGRMLQALAGIKAGVREGRFGVFLKLRAGVNSYASVFDVQTLTQQRSTTPVMDLGGVVEINMSPRTLVRMDLGETVQFNRSRALTLPGEPAFRLPNVGIYGLPLRVGVGWRF
jgi:hypothetical protein